MTSHFALMVLFAVFVSTVFAAIARDSPAEQVRLGLGLFCGFVGAGFALGWAMLALPF